MSRRLRQTGARRLAGLLVALALPSGGEGTGWPCWRGPRGDNVSPESGWQAAGRELWRVSVGIGHSSCAIVAGRLYTLGFDDEAGADRLSCLDAETGARLWSRSWDAEKMANHHSGGTLSTPAVGEGRVWCTSRDGVLRAFEAEAGEPLHEIDLATRHGVQPTAWGFGGSPVLVDGVVVVDAGRTIAVDPESGDYLEFAHTAPCDHVTDPGTSTAIGARRARSRGPAAYRSQ